MVGGSARSRAARYDHATVRHATTLAAASRHHDTRASLLGSGPRGNRVALSISAGSDDQCAGWGWGCWISDSWHPAVAPGRTIWPRAIIDCSVPNVIAMLR